MTELPTTEFSLTEAQRWAAILAHDVKADGQFWYGVKTTGIYCRPSCPSRRPRQENVAYFSCPQGAQLAGFRACKRCVPDQIGAAAQAVARTQALLDGAETEPTLAELAQEVGMSPFHLQRIFKAQLGVSPKQYAMARRTEKLKRQLKAGQSVTRALYEAGHDTPGTLYAGSTDQLGMRPTHYARGGEGIEIAYDVIASPLGPLLVAATSRGLCSVQFGEEEALIEGLRREFPKARLSRDPDAIQPYHQALEDYFHERKALLSVPVGLEGTAFQQRVWAQLRAIPQGETRSYAEVARAIGAPNAVRAVASACAANPVGLVIPCHRVVRTGGQLSGYRWGVERKQALLQHEQPGQGE